MRRQVDTDREIAAIAARQYGVVARSQLPLSAQSIDRRVRAGRLHLLHRGVYAVGHTVLGIEGRWMAATLATAGVLSHGSAAAAWDLRPRTHGAIHVSVGTTARRAQGVRVHRTRHLEATTHRGIAITPPARTIIDLATVLDGRRLEQALDRADHLRLLDFAELRQRPIPPSLQAVLSLYSPTNPTRSELEECFLRLCDAHGIPPPQTNTTVHGFEVDFVWRGERLIVEVDGFAYHRSPTRFEADRERDVTLTAKGWTVLRFHLAPDHAKTGVGRERA